MLDKAVLVAGNLCLFKKKYLKVGQRTVPAGKLYQRSPHSSRYVYPCNALPFEHKKPADDNKDYKQ